MGPHRPGRRVALADTSSIRTTTSISAMPSSNYYPPYRTQSAAYHPYNSYSSSAATTPSSASQDSPAPLDAAITGRKLWKTLKSSKEVKVWPPDIEAKLIEGACANSAPKIFSDLLSSSRTLQVLVGAWSSTQAPALSATEPLHFRVHPQHYRRPQDCETSGQPPPAAA